MKKFMTFLIALFVFTLTSFGQTIVNGTAFGLTVDGSTTTDFSVTYNPDSKFILVVFSQPLSNVALTPTGAIPGADLTHTYADVENSDGVVMTKISYIDFLSGYNVYLTATTSTYVVPTFTVTDTTLAFNNGRAVGVASVVCDPNAGYDDGYTIGLVDGAASVVCDWTEQDTVTAYNNGLVDGANFSVDADDYQAGFEAGKGTCGTNGVGMTSFDMGVNVYPNPVNSGTNVTVDCPFFESVTVLTISGQVVNTYNSPSVPTSNLVDGMYFLNVKDTDGNVSATKLLVK